MKRLINRLISDRVVYSIIILNAVVLFLQSFQGFPREVSEGLYVIDYSCTVFFVFEMVAKIRIAGFGPFWRDWWNRFDFTIVLLSSPMLISPILHLEWIGLILVLRTARLIRLMRLLRFIPNIDSIWRGISRAMLASIGVFYALFLYLFILTLFATYFYQDIAPEHFGNPLKSFYSMFQLLTVEGWYEIPNTIARNAGTQTAFLSKLFFSFCVFTAGVLGLSIANAVFVDEMVEDNTDDLEDKMDDLQEQLDRIEDQVMSDQKNGT